MTSTINETTLTCTIDLDSMPETKSATNAYCLDFGFGIVFRLWASAAVITVSYALVTTALTIILR